MSEFFHVLALLGTLLTAAPGQATPIQLTADLDGASEFPPNASPATGTAVVDLDIAANTLRVQVSFSGLLANTTVAHIHCCVSPSAANPTVGVATPTPTFPGFPAGVTSGNYDQTLDLALASSFNPTFINLHGGNVDSARAFLITGMLAGESYLNIHTTQFGGGEIRGFLIAQVPEPGSFGLMGIGLAAALISLRRNRLGV